MAVMKIVNMAVMANPRVPAVRAMLVGMVRMVLVGAGDHEIPPSCLRSLFIAFQRYVLSRIARISWVSEMA